MRGRHIVCVALREQLLTNERPPRWLHGTKVTAADQWEAAALAVRRQGGGYWPTRGRHVGCVAL